MKNFRTLLYTGSILCRFVNDSLFFFLRTESFYTQLKNSVASPKTSSLSHIELLTVQWKRELEATPDLEARTAPLCDSNHVGLSCRQPWKFCFELIWSFGYHFWFCFFLPEVKIGRNQEQYYSFLGCGYGLLRAWKITSKWPERLQLLL